MIAEDLGWRRSYESSRGRVAYDVIGSGEQPRPAIPGSRLHTIPRAAHLAMEDAPTAVASALLEFFAANRMP